MDSTFDEKTNETVMGLDDTTPSHQTITLISKDQQRFELTMLECSLSQLITTALSHDTECHEIAVDFNGEVVDWVVRFLKQHNGVNPPTIEQPLRSKNMNDVTTEYCASFVADLCKRRMLFYKVIELANYLDIPGLLHLCCAKIASLVRGIPLEQIKPTLLNDDPEVAAN